MTEVEKSTQRWRWTALIIYLLICFYDFLFVPVWYGLNRPDISQFNLAFGAILTGSAVGLNK